jgi:hypothetical protein
MLQQVSPGNLQVVLKHNSDYLMNKGRCSYNLGKYSRMAIRENSF